MDELHYFLSDTDCETGNVTKARCDSGCGAPLLAYTGGRTREELGLPEVHPLTKEGTAEGGTRMVVYIIELGELGEDIG